MIEVHTSTVYGKNMSGLERIDLLREGVSMMVEYGGATVISEDTDWEQNYEVYVGVGGGIVYYIHLDQAQFLTIRKGRMVNGEFQHESTYSNMPWVNVSADSSQYIRMRIINGGPVWDLHFHTRSMTGSAYNYRNCRIRVARLISSIDNSEFVSGYLYEGSLAFPFYQRDQILINGIFYGLFSISPDYPQMNVDPNEIILFPALMYVSSIENGLGVPMVGGEMPYYMGIPIGVTLNPFTEFQVNGGRYISLGDVAIRSR